MSHYDGPSYYKNQHPKIKPLPNKNKTKKKQPKYKLPDSTHTRTDLKNEAQAHMETPPKAASNKPAPERPVFKNTQIPTSLQKLDGWRTQPSDTTLLDEVEARLHKKTETYLLLEDRLSDEMMQTAETTQTKPRRKRKAKTPIEKGTQEKITRVQEETNKNMNKPNAGLHRSLSNIIAEEQKGIQRSKLNSLFQER